MARRFTGYSVIVLTFLLTVLFLLTLYPASRAQEPGVTVINVPPEFSNLDIRSRSGLHYIDVVVSDYNSWADLLKVDVEVLDNDELQIAHVLFRQYPDNQSTEILDEFFEPVGQILVRDQSSVSRNTDPQTIREKSELHITFVISQVSGRWLRVTASDLGGLVAYAQVEYLTGVIAGATAVPPLVIMMLAIAASVVLVSSRLRRERVGV